MSAFTEAQKQAIEARGNVIVVAGAGTGKTRTLVERCLRCVMDDECSLENILMVTFTEATATEMRDRIRTRFLERLAVTPDSAHLQKQFALLDTASISTLHAFCLRLLREHFHEVKELDPQFTVLDEKQSHLLVQEALESVLDVHYRGSFSKNEAVRGLIRRMGRGSDERLRKLILKIHRYTQTLPDPSAWFREQHKLHNETDPGRWREWLVGFFGAWHARWLKELRAVAGAPPCVDLCITALDDAGKAPSFDDIARAVEQITLVDSEKDEKNPRLRKNWPRGTVGNIRQPLEKFFAEAGFLAALSDSSGATNPLAEDWQIARAQAEGLLGLAEDFGREFARLKRASAGVDFTDLEQFTLRLLQGEDGQPSAIACRWREQFDHVFVDEYQDINAAQDAILHAVSREGNAANRFLVGDVKQSIYRFRLADPHIFRRYEQTWRSGGDEGQRIPLSENFRSREAILDFINPFFAELMRSEVGGVEYGADARLQFGGRANRAELAAGAAESTEPRVEFLLIDKNDAAEEVEEDDRGEADSETPANGDGEEGARSPVEFLDIDLVEKEACLIARRLRQLHDERHKVWDDKKKEFRPVEWNDMVVLLRSAKTKSEIYAKAFHKFEVPLLAKRAGFYGALEVMDLLNLLHLLDNPQQDIPLLAVLRSPLVGLSVDELATIRAHDVKTRSFWTVLQSFHAAVSPVEGAAATAWKKTRSFLAAHTRWRESLRSGSFSACLETVLDETRYEALLQSESRGLERAANVRLLLDIARQFDPLQRQGLHRFLWFVETQQDAELDPEPVPPQAERAVRLMTIHQSKGLEYPVVVLADLGKKINFADRNDDLLLDEKYGLCQHLYPQHDRRHYPSLAHWLASRREQAELLGEELRLLYVAMTRARDTLILTGTVGKKNSVAAWRAASEEMAAANPPLDTQAVLNMSSALDWILAWLPRVTSTKEWAAMGQEGKNRLLRWTIYARDDQRLRVEAVEALQPEAADEPVELDAAALDELAKKIQWRYDHMPATSGLAKASVTALRRRAEENEEAVQKFGASSFSFSKSRDGAGRNELSGAEVGTAHHTFLQFVSLACTGSEAELRQEAGRLRLAGVLTEGESVALKLPALARFWDSAAGRQIRSAAGAVQRELPFTARFSPAELVALGLMKEELEADEFIVVQGVADLAVLLPEEIWLLDFKTDRMTAEAVEEKRAHYAPQLKLYAAALEKIYNRPVTRRWLHFFDAGETTSV